LVRVEDYLEGEQHAELRHEYVDGQLYAMTGASRAHGLLAVRIAASFDARLPARCAAFTADMKVRIKTAASERYYYPDVVVTCEQQSAGSLFCTAPLVVVEILSPATARIDRDEKFDKYRLLDSLAEYLLVHQDRPLIEIFRRATDWQREEYGAGEAFTLASVDLAFAIDDLYRRIDFEEQA
jgi:Uma2 family endonuclease